MPGASLGQRLLSPYRWSCARGQRWVVSWGARRSRSFIAETLRGSAQRGWGLRRSPLSAATVELPYPRVRTAFLGWLRGCLEIAALLVVSAGLLLWGAWRVGVDLLARWQGGRGELPDRLAGVLGSAAVDVSRASPGWQIVAILWITGAGALAVHGWRRMGSASSTHRTSVDRLRRHARPLIVAELNRLVNVSSPTTLLVDAAPELGDVSLTERIYPRAHLAQLHRLERELGARVIGLSGPRGVGKTSLLRYLAERRRRTGDLAVLVSAPVRYSSRDFLLLLFGEACAAVLAEGQVGSRAVRRLVRVTAGLLELASFLLLCLSVVNLLPLIPAYPVVAELVPRSEEWSAWLVDHGLTWTTSPVLALLLSLACTGAASLLSRTSNRRTSMADAAGRRLVASARSSLVGIRYLQTRSFGGAGQFSALGLQLNLTRTGQLSEQASTLPELIAAYERFMAEAAAWAVTNGRRPPLVCIDEADRISDASGAREFLSDLKSVMAVPGCAFLVTLADDFLDGAAPAGSARAGQAAATFDHVLPLPPLRLHEALELLTTQVVGLSDRSIALCYVLGGGLPRDLVRRVRTLLMHSWATREDEVQPLLQSLAASWISETVDGMRAADAGGVARAEPDVLPPGVDRTRIEALWDRSTAAVCHPAVPGLDGALAAGRLADVARACVLQTVVDAFGRPGAEVDQEIGAARAHEERYREWYLADQLWGSESEHPVLRLELLASSVRREPAGALRDVLDIRRAWQLAE